MLKKKILDLYQKLTTEFAHVFELPNKQTSQK